MKVIDLLNKIANGEEVPSTIKYKSFILNRTYSNEIKRLYVDEQGMWFPDYYSFDLNDEVEIIEDEPRDIEVCGSLFTRSEYNKLAGIKEDKKIEELDIYNCFEQLGDSLLAKARLDYNFNAISDKINEIIEVLNEQK